MIVGDPLEQVVTVRGRVYRYATEPRCHICTSPYRTQIEDAAMESFVSAVSAERVLSSNQRRSRSCEYAAIARTFSEAGVRPDSIRRHFDRGHHPWLTVVRQIVMADRAALIGQRIAANG